MRVNYYHVVNQSHVALSLSWSRNQHRLMRSVVEDLDLESFYAQKAVVAYHSGRWVGVFRYSVVDNILLARGTCVLPNMRRHGVAKNMWRLAIAKTRPSECRVWTASPEGAKLVTKLSLEYNRIYWQIG